MHLDEVHAYLLKRTVNPVEATISLIGALPASLQALGATNSASANAIISSELSNTASLPSWFLTLPTEVQSYFLAMGTASASAGKSNYTARISSSSASSKVLTSGTLPNGQVPASGTLASASGGTGGQSTESGGLSTGAKAGIGVGITLSVILLAALAFLFFRARKKIHPSSAPVHDNNTGGQDAPEVVPLSEKPPGGAKVSSPITKHYIPELETNKPPAAAAVAGAGAGSGFRGGPVPSWGELEATQTKPPQPVELPPGEGLVGSGRPHQELAAASPVAVSRPVDQDRSPGPLGFGDAPITQQAYAAQPSTGEPLIRPSMSPELEDTSSQASGAGIRNLGGGAVDIAALEAERSRLQEKKKRIEELNRIHEREEELLRQIEAARR